MRRKDREVTDPGEISAAFRRFRTCTLGIEADGHVRLVPMCFGYSEGCLYFHSSFEGEKIGILKKSRRDLRIRPHFSRLWDTTTSTTRASSERVPWNSLILSKRKGQAWPFFSGISPVPPTDVSDPALEGTCAFRVRIGHVSMKRDPAVWEKPVLETERLTLRAFSTADAEELRTAADHPVIAEGTAGVPHPYTLHDAEVFLSGRYNDFLGETGGVFAVVEKASDALIGCTGIMRTRTGSAEIGYWITPSRWNRGYCTEAVMAVLKYGFDRMGLHRISALHFTENPGSGRVLEKAGMQREGLLRGYLLKDGTYRDAVIWSVLRSG